MGIISDAVKVMPTCRYGHGALGRIRLENHEGIPRTMVIPTFLDALGMGPAFLDGKGYTVTVYRCSTCGYLEFFDDEVGNG
jgi:hypothetical protein